MWYARSPVLIACCLLASIQVAAQTIFHNDGNVVHLSPGAVVFVQGGVNNLNDGILQNGGTFHFSADWTSNTAASDDADALSGVFVLEGVRQRFTGTGTVALPSVTLTDRVERVVQRNTHVSVAGEIGINDAEWATQSHLLTIRNAEPSAITRDEGYVSSDSIGGYLVRHTDRPEPYVFPVGSTGTVHRTAEERYRPVYVTPVVPGEAEFAVRFANVKASDDRTDGGAGFDLANRHPVLNSINEKYYYMIDRPRGDAAADIGLYYPLTDGRFSTVAQVQETGVWEDANGEVTVSAVRPLYTEDFDRVATVLGHDDFTKPVFTQAGSDQDDDGVPDRYDLDADNDGIANVDEAPSDPYADEDGDGLFDYIDPDFSGCGTFVKTVCGEFDFDGDGLANHLDLDADGDGVLDIIEAGGDDPELDGQVPYQIAGVPSSMLDLDRDGLHDERDYLVGNRVPDGWPEVTTGTAWPLGDRDGDGLRNFVDVDSDGDGIPDFVEGQSTAGYVFPDLYDANRNGIDHAFDFFENGSYGVIAADSDGDGEPDYLDLNSDNERTSDLAEGHDYDGNGLYDGPEPTGADADADGLDDVFDLLDRRVATTSNAANAQFAQNFSNAEVPGTEELDWREKSCKQQDCKPLLTERNQRP